MQKIEEEIKTMPNYFSDYDTTVHFISEEELKRDHSSNSSRRFRDPHRKDRQGTRAPIMLIEYTLKLGFQPGIYLQCYRGLCKSRSSHEQQRDRPAARPFSMWLRLTFPR